ncbi:MAG: ABC transporter ATP-binding protein [Chthonomonas sp.]|nr:ABC transporter ATP-binding protein [Chthonomonas sp.]
MSLVEARNLTVQYRAFTALQNFSASIGPGCTGLLGPNGAGKTTFIKTMMGFIRPAVGSVTVLGLDSATESRKIRQAVGFMPEQDCHIPGISAVGFVAYAGELSGMPADQALRRAHEVLEYCGLGEARYRLVETYSTGMKQRIKLAQALIHGPKLLFLDEPTNGLDPRGREDMLELVRSISHGKDVNVIVSSHLLPDIERTCDQVVVVAKGELRAEGLISDLTRLEGAPLDIELKEASPGYVHALQEAGLQFIHALGSTVRVRGEGRPEETGRRVLEIARKAGVQVRGYQVATRSLEEAFLEVIR